MESLAAGFVLLSSVDLCTVFARFALTQIMGFLSKPARILIGSPTAGASALATCASQPSLRSSCSGDLAQFENVGEVYDEGLAGRFEIPKRLASPRVVTQPIAALRRVNLHDSGDPGTIR